jgi:hypothetical protein
MLKVVPLILVISQNGEDAAFSPGFFDGWFLKPLLQPSVPAVFHKGV